MQAVTRPAWSGLPDKLVLAIFQHCLDTPAVIPPPPGDERITVMTTCRQWRTLIASSPQFWHNVIFLPVASGRLSQLVSLWLQRTAGVPVSIAFNSDFKRFNGGSSATHAQQLIYGSSAFCIIQSIILPCIDRITSLTCTLATDQTMRAFFTIPPGRFRSLEELEIILINQLHHYDSSFYHWEFPNFTVFQGLPSFREVKVHILNGFNPHHLGLPWGQLSTLNFESNPMSPDTFLGIVQMSQYALISGRFWIESASQFTSPHTGHSRKPLPIKPVTAHALQDLHLNVTQPSQYRRMFKALRLPALTFLSIEVEDTKEGSGIDVFIPMLKKAPSLEYFSIDCYRSHLTNHNSSKTAILLHQMAIDQILDRFFAAIPSVQSLRLGHGLNIGSLTLQKLARGELLPALELLECGSMGGLNILSMVSQRNDAAEGISLHPSIASSSQLQLQPTPAHKSISLLTLLVPVDDLDEVSTEAENLLQYQSTADTEIFIDGMDPRFFY